MQSLNQSELNLHNKARTITEVVKFPYELKLADAYFFSWLFIILWYITFNCHMVVTENKE